MKKDLVYFSEFKHNCLQACWYNYLILLGCCRPLYYIDTSIKLYNYSKFDNRVAANTGLYSRYLKDLYINFGEIDSVWFQDCEMLREGNMLICDVDVFYLSYRKEYMKRHGSHGVICVGVNEGVAEIIDWSEPYFFRDGINLGELIDGRTSLNPYNDNPYSGKKINSFSIGLRNELEKIEPQEVFRDWFFHTRIELTILNNIRIDLLNAKNLKQISDYMYLVYNNLKFSKLFWGQEMKDFASYVNVFEIIKELCSVTYTFHFKVMKYYLSRKSADVERCNDSLDVLTTLFTELSREVEKCKKKWD